MKKSACTQSNIRTHGTLFLILLGLSWAGCVRGFSADKLTCTKNESCPKDYYCSLQGSGVGKCVFGSRSDASAIGGSRGEVGNVPMGDARLPSQDGAGDLARAGGTDAAGGAGGNLPATSGASGTGNAGAGGAVTVNSSNAGGMVSGGGGGSGIDAPVIGGMGGGAGSVGGASSKGGSTGPSTLTGGTGGSATNRDAAAGTSTNLPIGASCRSDGECALGNCVDDVCCNSKCAGQCQACAETGSVGTCKRVTSGTPRGLRAACENSGDPVCGGRCDGTSDGCSYPSNATSCGTPGCNLEYTSRTTSACNSKGSCEQATTSCASSGQICLDGTCTAQVATGGACQGDGQCQTGHCCTGKCRDFLNDNSNCGSCGNVCQNGQTCNGSGLCACPPGTAACGAGACVDVLSSDGHCGSSCTSCYPQAGYVCSEGNCVCSGKLVAGCGCLAWNFNNGSAQGWGPTYSSGKTMCNDFVASVGLESALDGTHYLYASFQGSDCVAPMGINLCSAGTALNGLTFSARVRFSAPFNGNISLWTTNNPNIPTDFALGSHPADTWYTVTAPISDSGLDTQFGMTFYSAVGANWNGMAMIDNVTLK